MAAVSVVVEGYSDEGVARTVLAACGLDVNVVHGRRGKDYIRTRISSYNLAAKRNPWFVLADLDDLNVCPSNLCGTWLPHPEDLMVFRFAVVEVEAWLLADRERVASFLGVAESRIPSFPDGFPDPEQKLISLARHSRKRDVRAGLVPRAGSGVPVGPTYASDVREFSERAWRPGEAALHSPSLARCMKRLRELAAQLG